MRDVSRLYNYQKSDLDAKKIKSIKFFKKMVCFKLFKILAT